MLHDAHTKYIHISNDENVQSQSKKYTQYNVSCKAIWQVEEHVNDSSGSKCHNLEHQNVEKCGERSKRSIILSRKHIFIPNLSFIKCQFEDCLSISRKEPFVKGINSKPVEVLRKFLIVFFVEVGDKFRTVRGSFNLERRFNFSIEKSSLSLFKFDLFFKDLSVYPLGHQVLLFLFKDMGDVLSVKFE